MPFQGFEGPAGTGKTHRLLGAVSDHCAAHGLRPYQKILALTFMHGSRRRLDARLRLLPELRGRSIAMTIDRFARLIWHRWRTLAEDLAIVSGDFDQTCNACGQLLERPEVASWVARSYPVVLVDEAQELAPSRLRIIKALGERTSLFVAADEFQCLDDEIDTAPFMEWFRTGRIIYLDQVHRTNRVGLLAAAQTLRRLATPQNGPGLSISYKYPNVMPFAIGAALNRPGSKAVLYAPVGASWARQVVGRLAQGLQSSRYDIPPLVLRQEIGAKDEASGIMQNLACQLQSFDIEDLITALSEIPNPPVWLAQVRAALQTEYRCQGNRTWTRDKLAALLERKASNHRAYASEIRTGIPVMSIHQAKNREFEHVVVLWPPGIPGTDELKARLLYNAITRAQRSCKVFVRTPNLLKEPPFDFT